MDALAAYGSDDSSSDASNKESPPTGPPPASLSGLVDYSDDDSNDDSQKKQEGKNAPKEPAKKRRKRSWDNADTDDTLPPPPLSDTSMIHWTKDYSASYRTPSKGTTMEKLERMRSQHKVSWAKHLKSQHEFHNPHFFANVVSHFGIKNPLESNVVVEESPFQSFEFDLPSVEEHARIREQERSQLQEQSTSTTTSTFAQQQLEHAMQTRR